MRQSRSNKPITLCISLELAVRQVTVLGFASGFVLHTDRHPLVAVQPPLSVQHGRSIVVGFSFAYFGGLPAGVDTHADNTEVRGDLIGHVKSSRNSRAFILMSSTPMLLGLVACKTA